MILDEHADGSALAVIESYPDLLAVRSLAEWRFIEG